MWDRRQEELRSGARRILWLLWILKWLALLQVILDGIVRGKKIALLLTSKPRETLSVLDKGEREVSVPF